VSQDSTTTILHVGDHKERAVAELLFVNRMRPRIVALVRALAGGVQLLEDPMFDFITGWNVDLVSGDALDVFGTIVGEQRQGLDDATYRRFIRARVKANVSEGTRDELIEIWQLIMAADVVRYFDALPAGFSLYALRTTFLDDTTRGRAKAFMQDVKPAGVAMELIEGLSTNAFTYDDGPGYDVGQYARYL
jgi:hypothetical protein